MRGPASLAAWGPARMAVGPGRARIRRSGRGLAGRLSFHRGATCLARHPGAAVLPLHLGRRSGRCCMHLHSLPPGQGPRRRCGVPGRAAGHLGRRGRVSDPEHRPRRQTQRTVCSRRRAGPSRSRTAVLSDRSPGRADSVGSPITATFRLGPHALISPGSGVAAPSTRRTSHLGASHHGPRSATTLLSSISGNSSTFAAARSDGLRYLNITAPAIEAAYSPVKRSIVAASTAATLSRSAELIHAVVLPQLRKLLQHAEAIRPGTPQLVAIHNACLAAFRDAITQYSLLARALQHRDPSAIARIKLAQQAAKAEWTTWQLGLLRLKLGNGIPMTP